jgi:hypothetical protein
VLVAVSQPRGSGAFFSTDFDSAYDLGLEPALQAIPHTANTLTIEWLATGDGWQGSSDESWGIENVEVAVWSPTPIKSATWGQVRSLFR